MAKFRVQITTDLFLNADSPAEATDKANEAIQDPKNRPEILNKLKAGYGEELEGLDLEDHDHE